MRFHKLQLLLWLLLPFIALSQPCERGISTSPDNAFNMECPANINVFDWRTSTFTTTDPALPNGELESPYWQDNNPPLLFLYNEDLATYHDFEWEEGWELLEVDMNYSLEQDFVYFIMYNKYESLMRVFTTLPVLTQNTYAALKLRFTSTDISALLSPAKGYSQTMDETSIDKIELSSRYTNNSYRFVYFDIPVEYDPCTCIADDISLSFEFGRMTEQKLDLYGRYVETDQSLASILSIGQNEQPDFFPTEFLAGVNRDDVAGASTYNRWGELVNQHKELADELTALNSRYAPIKAFNELLTKVLSTGGTNFLKKIPLLKANFFKKDTAGNLVSETIINGNEVFQLFFGGSKLFGAGIKSEIDALGAQRNRLGTTMLAHGELVLKGSLLGEYEDGGALLSLPGSDNSCSHEHYPKYNEVLGRVAMLEKPVVNVDIGLSLHIADDETTDPIVHYIRDYRVTLDPTSIKYVFNPAAKIDEEATSIYGFLKIRHPANISMILQNVTPVSDGAFVTPLMPLDCMGEYTANMLEILQTEEPVSSLDIELVLIVEYVFEDGNTTLQQYTYHVNKNENIYEEESLFEEEAPAATHSYPSVLTLETQHFTSSQTIFAWNQIIINGELTAAPGVQVDIISPEIIINSENNAFVGSNIDLYNEVTPFDCSPLGQSTEDLEAFCNSSTYQANHSAQREDDGRLGTAEDQESLLKINETPTDINLGITPNPIGHHATIKLDLPKTDQVSMSIYDTNGRLIQVLFSNRVLQAGHHLFDLSGADLPEGMYVLNVQTEVEMQSVRFVR